MRTAIPKIDRRTGPRPMLMPERSKAGHIAIGDRSDGTPERRASFRRTQRAAGRPCPGFRRVRAVACPSPAVRGRRGGGDRVACIAVHTRHRPVIGRFSLVPLIGALTSRVMPSAGGYIIELWHGLGDGGLESMTRWQRGPSARTVADASTGIEHAIRGARLPALGTRAIHGARTALSGSAISAKWRRI